jgi:ankyrin repeat protein
MKNGADVNARDSVGQTPLHMTGNSDIAEMLLENGADVKATDVSGLTPIHTVCLAYYQPGVIRILLQNGAEVNGRDSDGRTPLHMAGIPEAANVLLENGADVNATDISGRTPMHASACFESIMPSIDSTTQALLKNGAEVNARDSDGRTPLHMAKLPSSAKVLLDNCADVNAVDVFGRTPLHASVSRDHERFERDFEDVVTMDRFKNDIEVTRVLLKNGAEVNARDLGGRTPLQLAKRHCRDILIEFGADMHDVEFSDESEDFW